MSDRMPHLVLTSGEPAGIGPDLAVLIAQKPWPFRLTVLGDPAVFQARAERLGVPLDIEEGPATSPHRPGGLCVLPFRTEVPVEPGKLEPQNAAYVAAIIEAAARGCLAGEFDAMVTAPVHKGNLNRGGIFFTGHTEFIAQITGGDPVMLLATETPYGPLRVALATTHIPLKVVHHAVVRDVLIRQLRVLATDLEHRFELIQPKIAVLGLNPHAGEGGHLGREELDEIVPAIEKLRAEGFAVEGPLSADTAFLPKKIANYDAYLAMFHDQGLPVLKFAGFGRAVNVTLGLPIIRTSVDHGTALELAGTGKIETGSLSLALELAAKMAS